MTNVNDIYQSNYLTASDLQGKEPTVSITEVQVAKMNDGQPKLCVYVNNRPKGIVLNKTNAKAIAMLYGDESNRWIGKKIKLVTVWTDYQGKPVQAIRIVPPVGGDDYNAPPVNTAPVQQAPPADHPASFTRDLDDEVPF